MKEWLVSKMAGAAGVSRNAQLSPTFCSRRKFDFITHTDVNDPEESLILLLEFLLVEDLDRQNTIFIYSAELKLA